MQSAKNNLMDLDFYTMQYVNRKDKNILWLRSVLEEQKQQYALLYKRTKKYKRDKKTAYELVRYYEDKNKYIVKPKCKECKSRCFKLSKLKKDLVDRMQRIEETMNAKEDLLKKMRTLDPRIEELKRESAEQEIYLSYLQDNPTLFNERREELLLQLYPREYRINFSKKEEDDERKRKEIENQIRIETQEKKEIFDDLASLKKQFIDKNPPQKRKKPWWEGNYCFNFV